VFAKIWTSQFLPVESVKKNLIKFENVEFIFDLEFGR